MKTIFIMGILSFFCDISAAQPQYWGEETYDLENVAFHHFLNERMVGMDTEQFFRLQNDFTVDMFVGGIEQFE